MEIEEFIEEFATIFDDTEIEDLKAETNFRELDEWSSLHALATMSMLEQTYGRKLSVEEMKKLNTIQDLFNIINS